MMWPQEKVVMREGGVVVEKSCSTKSPTGCMVPPVSTTERAAATISRKGVAGLRSINLK